MLKEYSTSPGYADLVADSPDDFQVHTRVYTDPQVFAAEMAQIFEQTWVYVGHESEVPQPGDYKTAAVGRLPVIVSRAEDGQIHVLLNICRHRGSVVCREERGNTQYFRCPYHNWVYRNNGALAGIPDRAGYPPGWGERLGGLVQAPRVSTYRGMIFASFAATGDTLEAHFGPLQKYIDSWFDHSPVGRVKLSSPYRAMYHGNWKFQAENSTDGWHARYVHESALRTLEHFGGRSRAIGWPGCTRGFAYGHGLLETERNDIPPEVDSEFAAHLDLLARYYGAATAEQIYLRRHIALFPNLHLMEFKFRVIQPVAVDKTIVYEYPVQLEGVPEDINQAIFTRVAKDISVSSGSLVAGMVNADDVEIFARMQSGLQAAKVEWLYLSRGLHRVQELPGGAVVGERTDEVPQRAFYREWARLMATAPASEV
jgi:phenylpropionate dioxygenase-like ring-hydroxylating dioxygenase large terminal subunit